TPFDVELVVRDVPAFGACRIRLEPGERVPDVVDEGREIVAGDVRVADRDDSYDCDPLDRDARLGGIVWTRRRHPSGLAVLEVRRVLCVPRRLAADRTTRTAERVDIAVVIEARVAPGVP